jgi:uncharacterized protein YndB with AHSA1/START domain
MANPTAGTVFALTVERTIAAPPERVFEAFTQAPQLSRWFKPAGEYTCKVPVLEPRAGGRYRIEMHRPDGGVSVVYGTYDEVSPPSRLVFTWAWEDKPADGKSRVTVTLESKGAGTRLVLVHEQLPSTESREAHTHGWNGCLDQLVKLY